LKIKELTIKNFKNIVAVHMKNIPDLVVIAGPNGCGKTSVFDAIRIFKAIIGPYSRGELGYIQSIELKNQLKNVVNLKAEFAEISISIELSRNEKNYLSTRFPNLEEILSQNNGLLAASVRILSTGEHRLVIKSESLSELLRHYDPTDEIGTFEYIPSYREIPLGALGEITLGPQRLEEEKRERTATVRNKFNRLKYYLVMMFIFDKMELSDTASKFMPEIQGFFKDFFFPKEFEGIRVDRTFRWHFPVKMPDGVHDIDFLSSGEKEILMTYTNILKMKLTGSVILFDEPDLHLNAALERKMIARLKNIVAAGNQIWVATHSLEIIGTVPLENLYKMYTHMPEGGDNQIELCSTKRDLYETLELIGASTGLQLVSQKIVFVEGPSDKEILQSLFEEFGDIVSFVETKGLRPLMGLSSAITDLLDQVTKYETFYMIRDRDLLSDAEAEEIHERYTGKVFIWNVRSIENYLLNPEILIQVLNQLGIKSFDSKESLLKALGAIADDLKVEMLADMFKYEIHRRLMEIGFGLPSVNTEEDLKKAILEVGEVKRNRLMEQFSDDTLRKLLEEKKTVVDSVWDANYLQLCDSKRMLKEFIDRYIKPHGPDMNVPSLRSLIVNQMKLTKKIPRDIKNVMEKILGEVRPHKID